MRSAECSVDVESVTTNTLVTLARLGEPLAWCELIGRYERLAFRTALAILRHQEDAEDAAQEASLRAYRNIGQFEGKSAFSTWFTRIVINTCLMQLRKRKRRLNLSLDELTAEDGPITLALQLRKPRPSVSQRC